MKDARMKYVTLGKTGLRVSIAGLGCGGNSRLGLGRGKTEAEAIALVRQALDLGINFLDTAAAYGTEAIVSKRWDGWQVQINLQEPHHGQMTIVGYLVDTLDRAKSIGDEEILRFGHICSPACKEWTEIATVS